MLCSDESASFDFSFQIATRGLDQAIKKLILQITMSSAQQQWRARWRGWSQGLCSDV